MIRQLHLYLKGHIDYDIIMSWKKHAETWMVVDEFFSKAQG